MIAKILLVILVLFLLGFLSIFSLLAFAKHKGKKLMEDMAEKIKTEAEAVHHQTAPERPEGEVRVENNPNVSSTRVETSHDDDYIDFEEVT